jgi:hypothetical protein
MFRWDYGWPVDVEKSPFRMSGWTKKTRYVRPELHLAAAVDLKPGAKPAEVRLEPTASVKGKLVHSDGSPAKGGWTNVRLVTIKDGDGVKLNPTGSPKGLEEQVDWSDRTMDLNKLIRADLAAGANPNDGDSILAENLIPGTQLYIEEAVDGKVVRVPVVLKAGEVKDLGTLKLPNPK